MKAYEIITDRIIAALDAGVIPWKKPWSVSGGIQMNYITKKPYRGLNVFLTLMQGYASPYWLTFRQTQEVGGQVRKGEKGTPVIFWSLQTRQVDDGNGDFEEKEIPFIRFYTVFNISQVDGIVPDQAEAFKPLLSCESVIVNMPQAPAIVHGMRAASYSPATDTVSMPPRASFNTDSGYYTTLYHELTHSTGHTSRLNRKTLTEKAEFGSEDYSKEELVAELGAAFLCGHAGIEQETIEHCAAYIASWRARLSDDKRLIISAAAQAQKAADYILGRSSLDRLT